MSEKDAQLPQSTLQSIDRTLQEILHWTRFANISKLVETLEKELDTAEKRLAYDRTDGMNGVREVSVASGTPMRTVANWWQKWFHLGLATESETHKGRMKKIVSLDDVGIKIPVAGTRRVSQMTQTQQTEGQQPASVVKEGI